MVVLALLGLELVVVWRPETADDIVFYFPYELDLRIIAYERLSCRDNNGKKLQIALLPVRCA